MIRWKQILAAVCLLAPTFVLAEQGTSDSYVDFKKTLARLLPQYTPDDIGPSSIKGVLVVRFGTEVVYVSEDGRYLMQGKLLDLETKKDLTEPKKAGARGNIIAGQSASEMITYVSKKPNHTVTVFTDIDCPYCRKFHQEMGEYNKLGITVRYMLFPRAGVGTESYKKAVSVWCAEDRNAAMDKAKAGDYVEASECKNPVQAQMALGDRLGVRGTPTIFLEDGTILPGYVEAKQLRATIDR